MQVTLVSSKYLHKAAETANFAYDESTINCDL